MSLDVYIIKSFLGGAFIALGGLADLVRSGIQAHPVHLFSPSPLPLVSSICESILTCSGHPVWIDWFEGEQPNTGQHDCWVHLPIRLCTHYIDEPRISDEV